MIATALEPILLDVELSVEEYDLEIDEESSYDVELATAIKIIRIEGEHYEGPYEVIPKTESIILETRNKLMDDDVTVYEIPYAEVSNLAGGKTATIGGI